MGVKETKERISINTMDDDSYSLLLEQRFISVFKNTKYSYLQKEVDDYFFDKWQEIRYFFIFDRKKIGELEKERIMNKDNEDRLLELSLLSIGLSYNEKDVYKYSEVFTDEITYEIIKHVAWKKIVVLYEEISFKVENNKHKVYFLENKQEDGFYKIIDGDIEEEFDKYIQSLKKTWVFDCYDVDDKNLIISLKSWDKDKIYDKIIESDEFKNKISLFFRYEIRGVIKKEWIEEYKKWKIDVNKWIIKEDRNYIVYWTINDSHIKSNKFYFDSSKETVLVKMAGSRYDLLKNDYPWVENYMVPFLDGKPDIYKFVYKEEWKIFDITNYNIFRDKIINNDSIKTKNKKKLIEVFRHGLPIIWITISWRQDKASNTIPPFFEISERTYTGCITHVLRENETLELFKVTMNWEHIGINITNLKKITDDRIKDVGIDLYEERMKKRLRKYSNIGARLVNEITV